VIYQATGEPLVFTDSVEVIYQLGSIMSSTESDDDKAPRAARATRAARAARADVDEEQEEEEEDDAPAYSSADDASLYYPPEPVARARRQLYAPSSSDDDEEDYNHRRRKKKASNKVSKKLKKKLVDDSDDDEEKKEDNRKPAARSKPKKKQVHADDDDDDDDEDDDEEEEDNRKPAARGTKLKQKKRKKASASRRKPQKTRKTSSSKKVPTHNPLLSSDEETEEEEEVSEEEGTGPGRRIELPSSDCMEHDDDGYIIISKNGYSPEETVTKEDITQVMADASLTTPRRIRERRRWMDTFKKLCGVWNRYRIWDRILYNAEERSLPYYKQKDLQDAWKKAKNHEEREKVAAELVPLWTTGYFGGKNRESFKFVQEREFMEEMKVRYKKEEREIGLLGCCARQATRSFSDILKDINRKGRIAHRWVMVGSIPKGSTGPLMKKVPDEKRTCKKKSPSAKEKRTRKACIAMRACTATGARRVWASASRTTPGNLKPPPKASKTAIPSRNSGHMIDCRSSVPFNMKMAAAGVAIPKSPESESSDKSRTAIPPSSSVARKPKKANNKSDEDDADARALLTEMKKMEDYEECEPLTKLNVSDVSLRFAVLLSITAVLVY
jgi:hypothetical protein